MPGFREAGGWEAYVPQALHMTVLRRTGKYLFPLRKTKEWAKRFVEIRIEEKIPLNSKVWKQLPRLREAFQFLQENDFFGHETWTNYLQKEFGIRYRKPRK